MFRSLLIAVFLCSLVAAQDRKAKSSPGSEQAAPAPPARTEAGLGSAAALRNENVQVNLIDNDSVKESNIRLGDNVTVVTEFPVERNYFATEHGRPPGDAIALPRIAPVSAWHGELFEYLQNSAFNARRFFQVGPVQQSAQNRWGGRFAGHVRLLGDLTGSYSQRKSRGMVNGNVLVPLSTERTALTGDPALRAIISRFFAAYPVDLPNRLDFDQRALNRNTPQSTDEINASLRLDRDAWGGRLSASHSIDRQRIDAFQLVAGQNPDTEIHTHRSRLNWQASLTSATDLSVAAQFNRVKSALLPEPYAVGPRIRFGYQIEDLGPDSMFPIDRAQNDWRVGGIAARHGQGSRHNLTYGAALMRSQLNGVETNNARGTFQFNTNFGRSAIENLRWGTPSLYEGTIGPMARGFRNWSADAFLADRWAISSRVQLYYGVRYNMVTAPTEVDKISTVPYSCDCNNFSPRLSLAIRGPAQWVMRAAYTVSFSAIPGVTYQQVRYNAPAAYYIQIQNPDLLNPLAGIDIKDPNIRTAPTVLARELVSPYVHQYGLTLERKLAGRHTLRLGYTGSHGFKLLDTSIQNRALPTPGIALTTATVDSRRADPRYYDVKYVVNGGESWMDAVQASLNYSGRRGFVWNATYTFGKAIDTGSDYSGTAANNDMLKGRAQSQFDSQADRKALSNFDSTHSLTVFAGYTVPRFHASWARLAGGWQVSGSVLSKTGTPLTIYVGSDSPGYGNVDGGGGDRPSIVDASILGSTVGNPDTSTSILRRDRFRFIVPGEPRGNLGRGTFRKGGIFNCNAALSRQWNWGGRSERAIVFRAEAFNATNHPQFDEPQSRLTSPSFGKITNTLNDGRVFQLSLRLVL